MAQNTFEHVQRDVQEALIQLKMELQMKPFTNHLGEEKQAENGSQIETFRRAQNTSEKGSEGQLSAMNGSHEHVQEGKIQLKMEVRDLFMKAFKRVREGLKKGS